MKWGRKSHTAISYDLEDAAYAAVEDAKHFYSMAAARMRLAEQEHVEAHSYHEAKAIENANLAVAAHEKAAHQDAMVSKLPPS